MCQRSFANECHLIWELMTKVRFCKSRTINANILSTLFVCFYGFQNEMSHNRDAFIIVLEFPQSTYVLIRGGEGESPTMLKTTLNYP